MRQVRLVIVGFGVVGQGLAELLVTQRHLLQTQYDLSVTLVGVATGRGGYLYREQGLDIPTLLNLARRGGPLTVDALNTDVQHWPHALDGLRESHADILAEATGTNLRDGEPGLSHVRLALTQGMHVITANKGPIALASTELFALARAHNVQLRVEATVMAGTPVISTICEGMAGSSVRAIRGILNGTTNYILSEMAQGRDYSEVLSIAQAQGYAEADPTADVEGYDAVAKLLILASTVFGQILRPEQVARYGITAITREDVARAQQEGKRIKLIASLRYDGQTVQARVEPVSLPFFDPLATIDGVMNAITVETVALPQVTIVGPGAGRLQTGQGLLADLIAVARASS
jgi:homoserine dehydrogenase